MSALDVLEASRQELATLGENETFVSASVFKGKKPVPDRVRGESDATARVRTVARLYQNCRSTTGAKLGNARDLAPGRYRIHSSWNPSMIQFDSRALNVSVLAKGASRWTLLRARPDAHSPFEHCLGDYLPKGGRQVEQVVVERRSKGSSDPNDSPLNTSEELRRLRREVEALKKAKDKKAEDKKAEDKKAKDKKAKDKKAKDKKAKDKKAKDSASVYVASDVVGAGGGAGAAATPTPSPETPSPETPSPETPSPDDGANGNKVILFAVLAGVVLVSSSIAAAVATSSGQSGAGGGGNDDSGGYGDSY